MGRALRPAALIVVVGVVVVLVSGQQYAGSVFVLALCYGIVTAGMAVQIGFSQQIVFSQCVFMGFGAYGVAMLNTHYAVPSLLATPVVMVAAGLAALLLGVVVTRASGLALAVATLMLPLIATGYISSAGYLGGSVGAPLTGNLWAGSTTQSIAIGNGLITVAVLGLVVRAERRGEIHAPEHHRGQRAGQPRPGSARRRRRDPAPPQQRFALGVSRTFQAVHLIRGRTVLDNVAVACLTSHRSGMVSRLFRSELAEARQKAGQTLGRLGMAALSGRDVSSLTLESQRMVELARAVAAGPRSPG